MSPAPAAVALIGLRCTGKSTVGRLLAERLGLPFVDLDDALAAEHARGAGAEGGAARAAAGELLAALGEPAFRDLETRALERVLDGRALVLATGGGVVEREANRRLLAQRARCFLLSAPTAVLAARLGADGTLRPALTGAPAGEELERLAARRGPWYAALAEARLDSASAAPERLAAELAERLG